MELTTIVEWLKDLQKRICQTIEHVEHSLNFTAHPACFNFKTWDRLNEDGSEGGGGTMSTLRGKVFEKAGVNFSSVHGHFSQAFAKEIPGALENPNFTATGVSLVFHPVNPHVPIIHMNVRYITTSKSWFGGGIDMTPAIPYEEDTKIFHDLLQSTCDQHDRDYYPQFKKWCDEYFYLPHRNEPRGIGGIFFDYLQTDNKDKDWAFVKDIGEFIINIYPDIVRKRHILPWNEEDKKRQLLKRGRYVEFNLIHDRGTRFGLMTNGNVEAILMSLPPEASWE